jgi:hypothetical protein
MNSVKEPSQIQMVIQEIDRLIAEMTELRAKVVTLSDTSQKQPEGSIQQTEYFGMWNDREDMIDKSSREWLENLRSEQWSRT